VRGNLLGIWSGGIRMG